MKSAVRLNPVSPLLFMTLVYFTLSALVPKEKTGLQKLSAQIDLGAPPLQAVVNNH